MVKQTKEPNFILCGYKGSTGTVEEYLHISDRDFAHWYCLGINIGTIPHPFPNGIEPEINEVTADANI
jgi:hypothetical protein